MNTRHRRSEHLDLSDLRLLDPAGGRSDRATSPAAQQLLGRIVETPRAVDSGAALLGNTSGAGARAGQQPPWPARGRNPWVLAGAAAVAVAVGVVTLPVVSGGSGVAFASWTPVPAAVAPGEADELQADCLASGRAVGQTGSVTAAMSERRGGFTFTLVATDEAIGNCMVLDPALTEAATEEEQGVSSWGPISDLPLPPVDGTSVLWGATFVSAAGKYTSAIGRAGADVVAVEIVASDQPTVQAHVSQGYFTAWWPGGPDDEITVTTTLSDGTRSARTLKTGQH